MCYIYYNWWVNTGLLLLNKVHSLGFTLSCTFNVFGQKYDVIYPPLQYHTEYFHCLKNLPCSIYSSLPPSHKTLATTDISTVFTVLPFPKCHMVGIIQYGNFQVHFFHLTIWIQVSSMSFLWLGSSFLFIVDVAQIVYPFTHWRTSLLFPSFGNF